MLKVLLPKVLRAYLLHYLVIVGLLLQLEPLQQLKDDLVAQVSYLRLVLLLFPSSSHALTIVDDVYVVTSDYEIVSDCFGYCYETDGGESGIVNVSKIASMNLDDRDYLDHSYVNVYDHDYGVDPKIWILIFHVGIVNVVHLDFYADETSVISID